MGRFNRIWGAGGVLCAVIAQVAVARADDAVAAQALFDQGKSAMAARNYATACPKFEESLRLQAALGTLLNLADCYEREGKLATAWSTFLELAAKAGSAGQVERARIGKNRAAALVPRLSNLVIVVAETTPGLEVKRDGTVAGPAEWGTPIPTDPGTHTVEAEAPGKQGWSTTVSVSEGAKTSTVTVPQLAQAPVPKRTELVIGPDAAMKPSAGEAATSASVTAKSNGRLGTQKVLALASAAVGVAGVAVGSYFGLRSIAKHNEAQDVCMARGCPTQAGVDLWRDAGTSGDRADVAFAIGAAGVVGATVLWFTAPKREGALPSGAKVALGPGTIQLTGAW